MSPAPDTKRRVCGVNDLKKLAFLELRLWKRLGTGCNLGVRWAGSPDDLSENTRDTKKFKLLFDENVAYGYRRNLLGLTGGAHRMCRGVLALATARS
jgi:hypothetical protein